MTNYYFLGTLLPSLFFDVKPELSFFSLEQLLKDNLTASDYEKIKQVRSFFDLLNIRSFWLKKTIDGRGEMSEAELEEALGGGDNFPFYVSFYLENHSLLEERLKNFPYLLSQFFKNSESVKDPFLKHYFRFEREFRLVLTFLRAKSLNKDIEKELQYEDPEEELIKELLEQASESSPRLPERFEELKEIFDRYQNDPWMLQKMLDKYRFEFIENSVDLADVFSVRRILAYFIQFLIVDRWFNLDKEKGMQMVHNFVKGQS